jgi:para-aminobenzoate synthetase component I
MLDRAADGDSLALIFSMPTLRSPALRRRSYSPLEAARGLRRRPGMIWCDSSDDGAGRISVLASDPSRVLKGGPSDWGVVREALAALKQTSAGVAQDVGLPGPGLFGTVDFDGHWCFGVYPEVLVYQHDADQWWEGGGLSSAIDPAAASLQPPALPAVSFSPLWSRPGFMAAVERALEYIANGDIYQVNLSQPWASPWIEGADLFGFYERLRAFSPAPYGAFFDLGGRQIASASPELFLRLSGRTVRTRPIKGTRPRHRSAQDDERAAYDLITSPKEISELIMITDLERNDLGRICEYGSVTVPDMLRLERYQQVFHLVSTVEGLLREDVDHPEALRACLPGGSISGAPKIRALEIIGELEPFPRGLYTGVLGWLGANGESQFSIAIRTAVAEGSTLHFHAGAGIVADSDPAREHEETWHKASTLLGVPGWAH